MKVSRVQGVGPNNRSSEGPCVLGNEDVRRLGCRCLHRHQATLNLRILDPWGPFAPNGWEEIHNDCIKFMLTTLIHIPIFVNFLRYNNAIFKGMAHYFMTFRPGFPALNHP